MLITRCSLHLEAVLPGLTMMCPAPLFQIPHQTHHLVPSSPILLPLFPLLSLHLFLLQSLLRLLLFLRLTMAHHILQTFLSHPSIYLQLCSLCCHLLCMLSHRCQCWLDISSKEQRIQEAIRAIKASGLKAGSTTEYSLSLWNAAKNFDVPCQTLKDCISGQRTQ